VKNNPLQQLGTFGQSIWLDYIRRDLIASGELKRLIEEDGLCGMTSNPAIFEKAIAGSRAYDAGIRAMALAGKDAQAIYEALSQHDVQSAADVFRRCTRRRMATTVMSASRSIPIWRTTPAVRCRKRVGCGPP